MKKIVNAENEGEPIAENTAKLPTDCVSEFLSLLANIRLAHWQADSRTNEHKALGDLYESVDGSVDEMVEILLGKNGSRDVDAKGLTLFANADLAQLLEAGMEIVEHIRTELETGTDDDMLNILADISAALNKAKYLLQL